MSAVGLQPLKWTTDQFIELYDKGFLSNDRRYELIDGDILCRVSPIGLPHAKAIVSLVKAFALIDEDQFVLGASASVELSDRNMPEPDVFVVKQETSRPGRFAQGRDLILAIEVSDTTLAIDRGIKRRIYAEAAVPEYWIVNLNARCVEVYRAPVDGDYHETTIIQEDGSLSPLFDAGIEVAVRRLLPKS